MQRCPAADWGVEAASQTYPTFQADRWGCAAWRPVSAGYRHAGRAICQQVSGQLWLHSTGSPPEAAPHAHLHFGFWVWSGTPKTPKRIRARRRRSGTPSRRSRSTWTRAWRPTGRPTSARCSTPRCPTPPCRARPGRPRAPLSCRPTRSPRPRERRSRRVRRHHSCESPSHSTMCLQERVRRQRGIICSLSALGMPQHGEQPVFPATYALSNPMAVHVLKGACPRRRLAAGRAWRACQGG